jgi:CO/xanthine dehydrogenase FAD-binding subunit
MIMSNAHPSLPRFELFQPVTLAEASQFLTAHKEDARPFMGGTDLFVRMRDGNLNPATLVNLKSIPGLNEMRFDPVEGLTIGSAVVMNHVIASADAQQHYPLLVEAARSVASYQLRNRATVVGNICNASPAGDTIGAALLYKGELRIYSPAGDKVLPLEDFFIGPGKTKLKTGEIVSALYIPPPPIGHQSRYYKLGRNVISDLSILASQPITEEVIQKAAEATKQACSPIDDVRSSAAYRRAMIERCTYRAVRDVWQRLQKDSPA